jgi:hypothetical protein
MSWPPWRYIDYNMKSGKPIQSMNFNGPHDRRHLALVSPLPGRAGLRRLRRSSHGAPAIQPSAFVEKWFESPLWPACCCWRS